MKKKIILLLFIITQFYVKTNVRTITNVLIPLSPCSSVDLYYIPFEREYIVEQSYDKNYIRSHYENHFHIQSINEVKELYENYLKIDKSNVVDTIMESDFDYCILVIDFKICGEIEKSLTIHSDFNFSFAERKPYKVYKSDTNFLRFLNSNFPIIFKKVHLNLKYNCKDNDR